MLLERGFSIEKVLMVTFTKAAAAELESRIRKFVRRGYKFITGRENLEESDKIRLAI